MRVTKRKWEFLVTCVTNIRNDNLQRSQSQQAGNSCQILHVPIYSALVHSLVSSNNLGFTDYYGTHDEIW
jgi:hypothetical protein